MRFSNAYRTVDEVPSRKAGAAAKGFLRGTILAGLLLALLTPSPQLAGQESFIAPAEFVPAKRDIAILLDSSGSTALRGELYNLQLNGLAKALRDSSVIPRDGTIALSVFTFNGGPTLQVPLTEIDSAATAEAIATAIEALKCATLGSSIAPCPFGETVYSSAILLSDVHLNQNRRPDARRTIIMATDGEIDDAEAAATLAQVTQARNGATTLGIPFEFDILLVGRDPESTEFETIKGRLDPLVSPQPSGVLPGSVIPISGGPCSMPGAVITDPDCDRQCEEFAEILRSIIRSDVSPIGLVVTTAADTPPGTPSSGLLLSLRQAIEAANANCGDSTITFADDVIGSTITPLVPLPPLLFPGIVIDATTDEDCSTGVSIDGSGIDPSVGDGLTIRSSRCVVRGLRIINFPRAGIGIVQETPNDDVVRNRAECNALESNGVAGVIVSNFIEGIQGDSIRNTISRNTILGSPITIDLAADGPTPNDPGDGDTGPNTLLNFPDDLDVFTDEGALTITGTVTGPTAAGSLIEIFAVTEFSVDPDTGFLVITGIEFLTDTTADDEGDFGIVDAPMSPTGIYTATVTDSMGNTSEVMFENEATSPAIPQMAVSGPIDFGDVQPGQPPAPQNVIVMNTGNAPLAVTACQLVPCDSSDPDQTALFTVTGCPTEPLDPGESATLQIAFAPTECGEVQVCLLVTGNDPKNPSTLVQIVANIIGGPQALLTLEGGGSFLDFGTVKAKGKAKKTAKQPARTFTIQNVGCSTLNLSLASVLRTGADVNNGKISNADDRQFFPITIVQGAGEIPAPSAISIAANQVVTFRVRFNPVIPAVASGSTGLSARQVLPDVVTSTITFTQTGGSPLAINLVGRVRTPLRLIDPDNPVGNPLVRLVRTRREFDVEFSAWDANANTSQARYEFLNSSGNIVATFDVDLTGPIAERNLARGQSFKVNQMFTGGGFRNLITGVRVTVTDGETSVSATASVTVAP